MKTRTHPTHAPIPTEQDIQHAAYFLWEEAGRPADRDQEFWFAAQERLRRTVTVSTRIFAKPAKTRARDAQPAAGLIR